MLARAGAGQAFDPKSPVPGPWHLFLIPHSLHTSLVFIDIPASFHHFFKVTAVPPLRGRGDILSWATIQAKRPAGPNSPQTPKAVSSPRGKKEENNSLFTIQHSPSPSACHLTPESRILNPVSCTTPLTTLAYLLSPVKRRNVHAAPALLWHARRCPAHAARRGALGGV